MPALVLHDADVAEGSVRDDYSALELLYHTDAYKHMLHEHFISPGIAPPRVMGQLSKDADDVHRRLVFLWNARFVCGQ